MKKDDGLWALWETALLAVFQVPVGALFASIGAPASTAPPVAVPARVRSSVKWNTNSGEVERSSERSDVERSVPPSRFATGT